VPVHIDQMTTDIGVASGDLPLTPGQIDKLVAIVLRRLDERDRDRQTRSEATTVRPEAAPSQ
jgi:hypothetical protein